MLFFITGAKGFLGRHLSRSLSCFFEGATIIGIGHGRWEEQSYRAWGLSQWVEGDIDIQALTRLTERYGVPDGIFHLAGGSAVGSSIACPQVDFQKSALSASAVVEWLRLYSPATKAVLSSSAAVYGAGHIGAIMENAPSTPYSPYGYNKKICELIFESYAQSFQIQASAVRLFSIYGAELRKQLLWDSCSRLAQGKTQLVLGGSGNELRDWLHVEDACALMITAFNNTSSKFGIINGGTGVGTTVRNIASKVVHYWGGGQSVRFTGQSRCGDPQSLVADTRMSKELGFVSSTDLDSGLEEYVRWFKAEVGLK